MRNLPKIKQNQDLSLGLDCFVCLNFLGFIFTVSLALLFPVGNAMASWLDILSERQQSILDTKEKKDQDLSNSTKPKINTKASTTKALTTKVLTQNSATISVDTKGVDVALPKEVIPVAKISSSTDLAPSIGYVEVSPSGWFAPTTAQAGTTTTVLPLTPMPSNSGNTSNNLEKPGNLMPPNMVDPRVANFNSWNKDRLAQETPDPTAADEESWTKMEVSPDLPPRVGVLSESLIGAVIKQMPSERRKRAVMPYDEFKSRVREAVLSYPDVGVADSQLGYAQAGTTLARAGLLPQIQGVGSAGKQYVGQDSYVGTPGYHRDGGTYGITVRQLLFDFGSAYFSFRAGKEQQVAAKELFNSKKSEQALNTVAAVVNLERTRSQMILAVENANARLSIVKLVRERYELGGGAKTDIIRAESRYAEALANITGYQNRLKAAESTYRDVFAKNPVTIVNGPNYEVPIEGMNKSPEELAGTYPGLLQLAKLRDAASSSANAAIAAALPSFAFNYNNTVGGISAPLAPSRSVSGLVTLSYNFYSGGADTARMDQAKYKALQAEREFQSGMRQYERTLSDSQQDVRNSDELLAARKVAALSAISSMRAVREQFAFNKGTLLDLLTAQENLYSAGRDLVDAESDRQIGRYRLLHLTSGLDRLFDLTDAVYTEQAPAVESNVSNTKDARDRVGNKTKSSVYSTQSSSKGI